jgi:ribonuclease P protein component
MAKPKKRGRLTRSGDFDRVYRDGRSRSNRYFVLYVFPRQPPGDGGDDTRLGISVGRKVGGAVTRNAVKRALREALRALEQNLSQSLDVVVLARPDSAGLVEREGVAGVTAAVAELFDAADSEAA